MKNALITLFLGIPIWLLAAACRLALVVIGWFFVPFTLVSDGAKRTPPLWRRVYGNIEDAPAAYRANRWMSYKWMAWRNPTGGLTGLPKYKLPEIKPNPDDIVRSIGKTKASRWMQNGIFWEYWMLKDYNKKIFGRYYLWWEFRIGWKFSDGEESFLPVIQLGPRSS